MVGRRRRAGGRGCLVHAGRMQLVSHREGGLAAGAAGAGAASSAAATPPPTAAAHIDRGWFGHCSDLQAAPPLQRAASELGGSQGRAETATRKRIVSAVSGGPSASVGRLADLAAHGSVHTSAASKARLASVSWWRRGASVQGAPSSRCMTLTAAGHAVSRQGTLPEAVGLTASPPRVCTLGWP